MKSINHSSSRFYNYNNPIINSEIIHILALLRRFLNYEHTTNEVSIYSNYLKNNEIDLNTIKKEIFYLKNNSPSIENNEQLKHKIISSIIKKDYTLLYTPEIGEKINDYLITKNEDYKIIYENQKKIRL